MRYESGMQKYQQYISGSIKVLKSEYLNGIVSKKNHSIWKIIFVLGSYEILIRMEGKLESAYILFQVKIF